MNELETRIDEILFYKWDPLNLSTTDWPRDEYRSYLNKVMELIRQRANDESLAKYLTDTAREMMEVECDEKSAEVATLINRIAADYYDC